MMVSKKVINMIWQQLLDMSRYSRYYSQLASRYCRYRNWLRVLLGLSATSVFVSLVKILPSETLDIPITVAGAFVGVVVICELVYRPGDKAATLIMMSQEISHLEAKQRTLWEKTNSSQIEDSEAMEESSIIAERVSQICKLDSGVDEKLNQQCTEAAYTVEQGRYAA